MLPPPQPLSVASRYPPFLRPCLVVGMETDTPLSRRIRQAIDASGMKHVEVAAAVGVARAQVTQWATGRRAPDRENLRALANVLGVSAEWLLEGRHIIEVTDDQAADIVRRFLAAPDSVKLAIDTLLPPLPQPV